MSKKSSPVPLIEENPGYWRVVIANPPINLFDPNVYAGLRVALDRIEKDQQVRVVVFESADSDYFIRPESSATSSGRSRGVSS